MKKADLLKRKEEITKELEKVDHQLLLWERADKPFVANVVAYSGHFEMSFKTEEKARAKLEEYASKKKFRNGLNYGVYLYRWNPDGITKTLIEERELVKHRFHFTL